MKKLFSFLLFIGVMGGSFTGAAQTPVTVGTGTAASGANVLFSTHTGGNLWSKSASLYTAAEIISAGGTAGNITKIAFNKQGTGEYTFGDAHLNIYIRNAPQATQAGTSLDWTTILAGATPNYSTTTQSFMLGTGWQEFNLTTPFFWNGSSNIEVLTAFHHPTTLTANMTWQYTVATEMNKSRVNSTELGSQTLFLQSNRPNIQFTITPAGPCTAPPTPGTASASTATVCPNTNFNLNLTGASVGSGQTFQWQSAPASTGPWTGIGTPGMSTSLTTSQVTTTFYRMAVTCSGQTAFSNAIQVSTSAIPVAGTFTIDKNSPASATNFVSFTAALASLECGGVNGPVTFNVAPNSGPYNERVIIEPIPGTSATNTVTFNGNNNVVTFANTTALRSVILLNGADFITLTGLNIQPSDATFGWGIHLQNGADNNTINNNTITIASTSTTEANSVGIVFSNSLTGVTTAGATGMNNVISGNAISGGYKGIHLNNQVATASNNQIVNNTITDFYADGIKVNAANGTLVEGNNISRPTRTTTTTFTGIEISGNSLATTISKNRIHNSHAATTSKTGTAYGIYITASDAPVGSENLVVNNLIYNINNTGTVYALYNAGSDGAHYYHNTISLSNPASTGVVRGVYQTTAATNIRIINNIFAIGAGASGIKTGLYFNTATSSITSNNNVLFVTGNVGYLGSLQATLANWQAVNNGAYDQNSVAADPQFANLATGDLTPTNPAINNMGQPLQVTTDITGLSRNPNAPDPGAYEFMNLTNDIGITAITSPNSTCGLSATETITVIVTNFGTLPQSNIPVSYTINGGTPVTAVIPGPLAPGANFTYSFTTTANMSGQGAYTIVASTNLAGDLEPTNNSTTKLVANTRYTTLPQLDFETPATGIGNMRLVTNSRSNIFEDAGASNGPGSTKGLILDGVNSAAWILPTGVTNPWNSNPEHFSATYICFDPSGGNPNDPLWLSFDLKQLYKGANANTNLRVTVNGTPIGGNQGNSPANTYRPPFTGSPIVWTPVHLDLTAYKNLPSIEIGFESNVKEEYANGTGTANLIDNIRVQRVNPLGRKDELLQSQLHVFPNPSNGSFQVDLPQGKAYELTVTDLTGREINRQPATSGLNQVNLTGSAKGIYLLQVKGENGTAVRKLIIE